MKALLIFAILTLPYAILAQNNSVETLKRLNAEWISAYPTKDSAAFERIFASDFELVAPNGNKMTRREVIHNLSRQEILSTNVDSVAVRMLDAQVGIVTAYITFVAKADDKLETGRICYQDVYMRRNKRWQAVAAHVTSLSMH